MALSSRGLGRRPLTAVTRVRIPLGLPITLESDGCLVAAAAPLRRSPSAGRRPACRERRSSLASLKSQPRLPLRHASGCRFSRPPEVHSASSCSLTTISFLFTTPRFLATEGAGFIMKDVVLLGGSIWAAGEALAAARKRGQSNPRALASKG